MILKSDWLKIKARHRLWIFKRARDRDEMGGRDFVFLIRPDRFLFFDHFRVPVTEYLPGVREILGPMPNPIRKAVLL